MARILILGAGGHAQVIADILLQMGKQDNATQPIGFLDDNQQLHGQSRLGLPILGDLAALAHLEHEAVIIGIGDNRTRAKVFDRVSAAGENFAIACHPRAIVATDVVAQPGTVICAGAVVNPGSRIGHNVILNTSCSVDHHNDIGDHAHIAPGAHLGGDVTIGMGTLVGIGATVMPQRRVGMWSVVGAAALVQRDVADRFVVVGVPAQVVHRLDRN
jgi:sugar O-acyltransferase (sialic acid O-acetyltransferase NeuD family)